MSNRIVDPAVPYTGPISRENFGPEKCIRIQGLPPNTAYRFYINLQCGPETVSQSSIALQISVNVMQGSITLNSLENDIWGEPHRVGLALRRGKKFDIVITCDHNQYKVTADSQNYVEFPQRIHYDRITHLNINGDVSIFQISYESASSGETSENGLGERNDFQQLIVRDRSSNLDTDPQPVFDPSAPPSYEVAVQATTRAPYPTNDPIGMPHVPSGTDFIPYPPPVSPTTQLLPNRAIGILSSRSPASVVSRPASEVPRPASVVPRPAPVAPRSASAVPRPGTVITRSVTVTRQPARDAPVPLNIDSANVQPEVSSSARLRAIRICFCTVFGIIGLIVLLAKVATITRPSNR